MGSYKEHQNILKQFKVLACQEFKDMRLFDRHVGLFYTRNKIPVKINSKGMADMYGIFPTKHGLIHLEFEVKSGNARQTKEQKNWQRLIEEKKGIYILVRNAQDAVDDLRKKLGSHYLTP